MTRAHLHNQLDVFIVHAYENNPKSQKHLDNNRTRFGKSCQRVYNWLREGREITVLWAANNGVSSLPRRIGDIELMHHEGQHLQVSRKWKDDGFMYYYFSEEDIRVNDELMKKPLVKLERKKTA